MKGGKWSEPYYRNNKARYFRFISEWIRDRRIFRTRTVTYNYYGRLEEIDFLKRLYDLERMPSFDSRFANAEQDIWQHTVNNDDYPYCWVFEEKDSIYKMVAMKYI